MARGAFAAGDDFQRMITFPMSSFFQPIIYSRDEIHIQFMYHTDASFSMMAHYVNCLGHRGEGQRFYPTVTKMRPKWVSFVCLFLAIGAHFHNRPAQTVRAIMKHDPLWRSRPSILSATSFARSAYLPIPRVSFILLG